MELIETVELASSASSITFSSIPQDYDDLVITISGRTLKPTTTDYIDITFNGVNTNLSGVALWGNGSTTQSFSETIYSGEMPGADQTANTFGNAQAYISNYSSSANKSFSVDAVSENNASSGILSIMGKLWSDTSAITSITVGSRFNDMVSGSTFSLYGITAGGDGTVTTS